MWGYERRIIMNPITKIISTAIIFINSLIDGLSRRTVENIKQTFYFFSFIAVIVAIILGYNYGEKSAKRGGKPQAELTNQVFTVDIKKERKEGRFHSMPDTDKIREIDRSDFNKLNFPIFLLH